MGHHDLAPRRRASAFVPGASEDAYFSPDGRTLAIAGGERTRRVVGCADEDATPRLTDPAATSSGDPALARSGSAPTLGPRRRSAGGEPRHALGRRDGTRAQPADHHEPSGRWRRAVDLLQPGLEAHRRPRCAGGRSASGGRDQPESQQPLVVGRTWRRRSSPADARSQRRLQLSPARRAKRLRSVPLSSHHRRLARSQLRRRSSPRSPSTFRLLGTATRTLTPSAVEPPARQHVVFRPTSTLVALTCAPRHLNLRRRSRSQPARISIVLSLPRARRSLRTPHLHTHTHRHPHHSLPSPTAPPTPPRLAPHAAFFTQQAISPARLSGPPLCQSPSVHISPLSLYPTLTLLLLLSPYSPPLLSSRRALSFLSSLTPSTSHSYSHLLFYLS